MSRKTILDEVNAERDRQDKKHPVFPSILLSPYWKERKDSLKEVMERYRKSNDRMEAYNMHTVYGIAFEELLEAVTAETQIDLRSEAIQNAALWVRVAEAVEAGTIKA